MDNWFDALSKRLAGDVSRRDALRIIVGATVGGLLPSTGLTRLWANTASSVGGQAIAPADVVCPDCGTCEMCDVDAGECGLPCDDPCTAAVLCNTAQTYEPYATVERYITDFGFTADGEPTALVTREGGAITMSVLTTTYTFNAPLDPTRTATVFFSQDATGEVNAFAITYQNGVPDHGYIRTPAGEFHDVLPPYQLPLGQAQASSDAQRESGPSPRSVATDRCHRIWELICHTTSVGTCFGLAGLACLIVKNPVMCHGIVDLACHNLGSPLCSSWADSICACEMSGEVRCPDDCCGGCSFLGNVNLCTAGVCTEYICAPGYTCIDGACTFRCLGGETPCGTPPRCCGGTRTYCCAGRECCFRGSYCCRSTCWSPVPGLLPEDVKCCPGGIVFCGGSNSECCCNDDGVCDRCCPVEQPCCPSPHGGTLCCTAATHHCCRCGALGPGGNDVCGGRTCCAPISYPCVPCFQGQSPPWDIFGPPSGSSTHGP